MRRQRKSDRRREAKKQKGVRGFDSLLGKMAAVPLELRNEHQNDYYKLLMEKPVVISEGPAGTGKTFLACHRAVSLIAEGKIKKIHIVRPAVTAEEDLGFLPGSLDDKMLPYLLPLYDGLQENCTRPEVLARYVEVSPLAFMRGRTFNNCVVLCDEAQNMTPDQIFMLLTRLGRNSRCYITGDLGQTDLDGTSGLEIAIQKLRRSKMVGISHSTVQDVVRSEIVAEVYRHWIED